MNQAFITKWFTALNCLIGKRGEDWIALSYRLIYWQELLNKSKN